MCYVVFYFYCCGFELPELAFGGTNIPYHEASATVAKTLREFNFCILDQLWVNGPLIIFMWQLKRMLLNGEPFFSFLQYFSLFRLAQSRRKGLDTGLVRRETFKGNVKDFLAVNNTLTDLERARSIEDLCDAQWMSPRAPSPLSSRPLEFHIDAPGQPPATQSENLIKF